MSRLTLSLCSNCAVMAVLLLAGLATFGATAKSPQPHPGFGSKTVRPAPMCDLRNRITPVIIRQFAPTADLCIGGAVATTDPTFNRALASSTGTGVGNGTPGNCSLSGTATATHYDSYTFNLQGCTTFPSQVTAQLCGPAGCSPVQSLDTVLAMYRKVSAGDGLTANGGVPGAFNPASACTNIRAQNDDSGLTPTSAGGSTCDQLNTADCLGQCALSTALSEFKRTVGSGYFTLVVAGFGNSTAGSYNLYVNAPAAGCTLSQITTAAGVSVSGRVSNAAGAGIRGASVTFADSRGNKKTMLTNAFGYYTLTDVPSGDTYIASVSSRGLVFAPRAVTVNDSLTGVDLSAQ